MRFRTARKCVAAIELSDTKKRSASPRLIGSRPSACSAAGGLERGSPACIAHFAGSGSPVSETGSPVCLWRRRLMPMAAPKAIIAAISPVAASTNP